ncbi:MAG: hypothetical protein IJU84_00915, partial [Clostridia bacterium]|nr:hypothetical protein [Clostridia bacterium]
NNEFHIHTGTDDEIYFGAIKKEFSSTDFIRNFYIELASNIETPEDIMDSKFGVVKEKTEQYLLVTGNANINYSAMIGNKREEKYFDKTYDGTPVERTRTVTDWSPISGNYSGEYISCVENTDTIKHHDIYSKEYHDISKNREDFYDSLRKTLKNNKENIIEFDQVDFAIDPPVNPQGIALEEAKRDILKQCDQNALSSLPGDDHKNYRSNGTVSIISINSIAAPVYEIDYEYHGKKWSNSSFAFGKLANRNNVPSIEEDITKSVNKEVNILGVPLLLGLITTITVLFVSMIMIISGKLNRPNFPFVIEVINTIFFIFYLTYRKKYLSNIYQNNQNKKLKMLVDLFRKKNMRGLTEEESRGFDIKSHYISAKSKLKIANIVMFCISLFVMFMFIISYFSGATI